ncbi:hypothetical protein ACFSWE_03780 [Leucobacter albus]|uniref:Uncharacterized protein n=1 Tax=Leucobacter albus TaxID=272210 RepID=A0ABW3TRK3_9MICO
MDSDADNERQTAPAASSLDAPAGGEHDSLLDRLGLIEAQPLERRAQGFEQLHDELLQELQRSDNEGA